MAHSSDRTIPRRTFIRGAAGLLGASALGIPTTALAVHAAPIPSGGPLAVMFWNGSAFVTADSLPSGDQTLASVQVTIQGFGPTAEIRRIDLLPLIRTTKGTQEAVVFAWSAPPAGFATTRSVMPVDIASGIGVSTGVSTGKEVQDIVTRFAVTDDPGPKLREGCYVLCALDTSWSALELTADGRVVNRKDQTSPSFQHVVVSIARV